MITHPLKQQPPPSQKREEEKKKVSKNLLAPMLMKGLVNFIDLFLERRNIKRTAAYC